MFTTFRQRLLLGIFVTLILSIPITAYFYTTAKEAPKPSPAPKFTEVKQPITSPKAQALAEDLDKALDSISNLKDSADEEALTPTTAVSFGPTLSLKLALEGRPLASQSAKVFLGIASVNSSPNNPQYLLSFTLDLPNSGIFSGISLAGLTNNTVPS
jgi:hypothetical protein